jgi:hypothetical protein
MSIRFSVFKTQKPKRFEYKPLYYDPVKEELGSRVNAIKKEQSAANVDESVVVRQARMSSAFNNSRSVRHSATSGMMKSQTTRIAIIAAILAAIAYFIIR